MSLLAGSSSLDGIMALVSRRDGRANAAGGLRKTEVTQEGRGRSQRALRLHKARAHTMRGKDQQGRTAGNGTNHS